MRFGNQVDVAAEKARVRDDRILGQRFDARPRVQRRKRFVEREVSVGADAAHEQIDAACGPDTGFVVGALLA